MRDIKFRVWDNVDYMSNPFTLQDIQQKKIQFTSDCIVMQHTGLEDKNNKEIYEGDIVIIRFSGGTNKGDIFSQGVVKWGVYDIGVNGREYSFEVCGPYVEDEYLYSTMISKGVEVIGNIYEHSHLLANEPTTN